MKKKLWVTIIAALVLLALAAGGVYAFLYRPVAEAYDAAAAASETAPYEEARAILTAAAKELEGRPFAAKRIDALRQRLDRLLLAEADRAVAADELAYAADLLDDRDPDRAQALRQTLADRALAQAYADADALEQAGRDEEALAAFLALDGYRDAAPRAAAVRTRMDFAAAQAVFTGENFDEGAAALIALDTDQGRAAAEELKRQKAVWIEGRRRQCADQLSAGAWHTAAAGAAPWIAGDGRYGQPPEQADKVFSGLASVIYIAGGRVVTTGETFGAEAQIASLTDVKKAAPGLIHALFLHEDGHVTAVGARALDRLPQEDWTDMTDVAAGAWHSVGLRSDGTVAACGTGDSGQCDVDEWTDITAVSAGLWHTVGLKADGTVAACGDNAYGQCDVGEWTDIVAVSCGACTTVGLKADGTVVACGDNGAGQCGVEGWTDVAAVSAGAYHTAGLRLDGTVITAGLVPGELPEAPVFHSDWTAPEAAAREPEQPAVTVYICGEGEAYGPWLYMDARGAALVCIDYSGERAVFRADMLATQNALPGGRVTKPDASGNYIKMPAVLAAEQARNNHAVLAFTGDYIGWTANRKAVMIRNGVVYYDRKETTTLAVLPDGTLAYYRAGETDAAALLKLGVRDSFSFGPLLVQDGKKAYADDGSDLSTGRVGFGYSDPYHYIAVVALRERQTALTFTRLANIFVSYGARVAYNLDGGHSSSLVFMGRELSLVSIQSAKRFGNIRGLSDVVVFLENDAVGAPSAP